MSQTYASRVVAPAQIALGLAGGFVIAAILTALDHNLWPVAILVFVGMSGVGFYLAVVAIEIDGKRITISQGRGEREPRVVYIAEVASHEVHDLSWPQCFGIGIDADDRTTRLTVRPGATLFLTLIDGEQLRISASGVDTAVQVLDAAGQQAP